MIPAASLNYYPVLPSLFYLSRATPPGNFQGAQRLPLRLLLTGLRLPGMLSHGVFLRRASGKTAGVWSGSAGRRSFAPQLAMGAVTRVLTRICSTVVSVIGDGREGPRRWRAMAKSGAGRETPAR